MIMQEARNEELTRNNLPRINETGYPLTLDSLYKQVSVVSRVHETLSSPTTAKSFTSFHNRRSPSPHRRSYSPHDMNRYKNAKTGELKGYDELDVFDNPADYGLKNCEVCLRNGFQGRHLQKFHEEFLRSKTNTRMERRNFRTSKYRNRSRSRSHSVSSAEDMQRGRRSYKDRSRSRSHSNSSYEDRRRGRSSHRSGKSSPHSPSPHSNRPPTPGPAVKFESP